MSEYNTRDARNEVITGDSTARLPLDATTIVTAALTPGGNPTYAQPALLEVKEGW